METTFLPSRARSSAWTLAAIVLALVTTEAAGLHAPAATRAAPLTIGPLVAQSAQAPSPRNLTFYLHNSTLAKDVNGISTPYVFDTVQSFGRNTTVSKLQEVKQDWYLFPMLAGNLTVNGTIKLHLYVSIDLVNSQITPTLTVSERAANGSIPWTLSQNYGSLSWWTSPHDLVLALNDVHHTFAAGASIVVVVDIVAGARIATIWYNSSWVPSHVILESDNFAQVQSIGFLDAQGVARTSFDPVATNKTIDVIADVTDPLGGYDIAWVNLTLLRPGGATVLAAVPMAKTAGTPVSYVSTYERSWNYSGQPVGRYNATVAVLDNSGLYYFREFFTTDGFLAQMGAFFYIGGLPVYVNVRAIDSKSAALAGATIDLISGGVAVDSKTSDAGGTANFTMAKGTYTFRVAWDGVQVASQDYAASANVSAANPLLVDCQVYDPLFEARDASGAALADGSLVFSMPAGQKIGPYKTNATGIVTLEQVPMGTYHVLASWRGVSVFEGDEAVSSNGVIAFECAVYELTVNAKAGSGATLPGVFVSVVDSTGLVFDAGITGADGSVVLRLPAGAYTIDYRYIATVDGTPYDSGVRTQGVSVPSQPVTVTLADFPIPFTSTLAFAFALAYAVTVAVLVAVLALVWRRRKGGKAASAAESETKN